MHWRHQHQRTPSSSLCHRETSGEAAKCKSLGCYNVIWLISLKLALWGKAKSAVKQKCFPFFHCRASFFCNHYSYNDNVVVILSQSSCVSCGLGCLFLLWLYVAWQLMNHWFRPWYIWVTGTAALDMSSPSLYCFSIKSTWQEQTN